MVLIFHGKRHSRNRLTEQKARFWYIKYCLSWLCSIYFSRFCCVPYTGFELVTLPFRGLWAETGPGWASHIRNTRREGSRPLRNPLWRTYLFLAFQRIFGGFLHGLIITQPLQKCCNEDTAAIGSGNSLFSLANLLCLSLVFSFVTEF